ncbi:hypothetical protein EON65_00625 [archaeon]|nr:MAG: hypothetical protein EON65_00625 [archaeon]
MDERNERLVMDRIVKTCCGDSGSSHQRMPSSSGVAVNKQPQYFLVTPKLLQALQALDHDDVTILLVWNGPGIEGNFKFENILQGIRRRQGDVQGSPKRAHEWDDEDGVDVKPRLKKPK